MSHANTVIEPGLEDGVPIVSDAHVGTSTDESRPASRGLKSGQAGTKPRRKKRFGLRFALVAVLTAFVGAALGQFLVFAHQVAGAKVPSSANADAIVVLTGGQARVNEAIRLLEEGRAKRLLISGVHPGTTREQLAAVTASDMPLEKNSVELDRVALNTAGNAVETANWVRKNGFSSLLVVTSAYHLPRAEVELSGALPKVDLIAYPVFSKGLNLNDWYREPATIRLLMREYVKYILARLRITVRGVS
ncbi:YdcF family protein [uncultured Roseibium sp.]|uniref:YdcF family protein n=1 Tax=uncultured Roseibium sp. TaxID=1936171 RepID=UPI002622DEC1|nr:YdcF family protein [uncultured Roseibium sp.]